jgi:ubiquinone/menaquinone biosynthesis C-methylase UbiE
MRDPTKRFSDRVENYAKYRPGYPPPIYDYLLSHAGLTSKDTIADLGSGTGLLSHLFLDRGHRVFAIEPNDEMRLAAEALFASHPNFVSINGRAEQLPLPDASVDFVVAGQAFHWFEPNETKREIQRVLKPGKQVALVWNQRHTQGSQFQKAYEELLDQFGTDFKQVDQQRTITDEKIAAFFAPNKFAKTTLPNQQVLDVAGLRGRLLSSSYVPSPSESGYEPMLAALDELFRQFQKNGKVTFEYLTAVFHAQIHS